MALGIHDHPGARIPPNDPLFAPISTWHRLRLYRRRIVASRPGKNRSYWHIDAQITTNLEHLAIFEEGYLVEARLAGIVGYRTREVESRVRKEFSSSHFGQLSQAIFLWFVFVKKGNFMKKRFNKNRPIDEGSLAAPRILPDCGTYWHP
jgi:hypothetical protein